MKSSFKSKISWFILLSLFGFSLPYAMEENQIKINIYSVNQLQNDFIALKKNPQKYVKFHLNAEKTIYSDAGGLYELLPYYQKINPLGEKVNYKIQWCDFEKQFQLIKVNPLGDLPRLNVEQTTIATLLEGDQFSRPTNADIRAYTTYEQMKENIKKLGKTNKELKLKIMETEEESFRTKTTANDEIASLQKTNEKLKEILTKIKEQNKKFKVYALEQNNIAKKESEQNKIQAEENLKILNELENLTSNLKEKEIQIEKKNEENRALEYQKGDLSYKLNHAIENEQILMSLAKEVDPLKAEIKLLQVLSKETIKQWDIRTEKMKIILNKNTSEMQTKNEEITKLNKELTIAKNDKEVFKSTFQKFKINKQSEIDKMKNWHKEMEEAQIQIQDLEKIQKEMLEKNEIEMKKLNTNYDAETMQLKHEIGCQQDLLHKQSEVINILENNRNCKDLGFKMQKELIENNDARIKKLTEIYDVETKQLTEKNCVSTKIIEQTD